MSVEHNIFRDDFFRINEREKEKKKKRKGGGSSEFLISSNTEPENNKMGA